MVWGGGGPLSHPYQHTGLRNGFRSVTFQGARLPFNPVVLVTGYL